MLRSNSKSLGNDVVSPEEEKERLQWEGFAEKEGCKSGMKQRVGDGKPIILSVTVSGIDQSCPWVGLTHGLGWVGLGRDFSVFRGLGWVHYCKSTKI